MSLKQAGLQLWASSPRKASRRLSIVKDVEGVALLSLPWKQALEAAGSWRLQSSLLKRPN